MNIGSTGSRQIRGGITPPVRDVSLIPLRRFQSHKIKIFHENKGNHRFSTSVCPLASEREPALEEDESQFYDSWCATPFVTIDNKSDPKYTILNIEILDYNGLMRVIAWCLNALDIVAEYAIMKTTDDNVAMDSYWVRTVSGNKLSNRAAEDLAERLNDYLSFCSPKPEDEMQTEFVAEPITISNSQHPMYTVVSVEESSRTPGQMLTIASILSGLNARVMEGLIQGSESNPAFSGEYSQSGMQSQIAQYEGTGRKFTFSICTPEGHKFDAQGCRSLLYALGIGIGLTSQRFPINPPNRDLQHFV